jgi:GH24 family phage-related lysozyme (muramidase)
MERSLELFSDGCVVELESDQPIKVFNTQGEIKALSHLLKFSRATTYSLAPADKVPPNVDNAQPRGGNHINQAGIKLITAFEGCELKSYQDAVDVWTIGYGHTKDVHPGMTITQAQAEQLLQEDLEEFESAVEDAVSIDLNPNQFAALVSFCFNLGAGSLFASTLLRILNDGDIHAAANEFPRWNKAGKQVLLGLTRRRLAERALFLSKVWEPFHEYDKLKLSNPKMQGAFVKHVQEMLIRAGFSLQANGIFDDNTKKAVVQFQQKHQLDADGIVGVDTTKTLC